MADFPENTPDVHKILTHILRLETRELSQYCGLDFVVRVPPTVKRDLQSLFRMSLRMAKERDRLRKAV